MENLQRVYGYYLDRAQWDQVADLFSDDGAIEFGQQGVYNGKRRIREFLGTLGPHGLVQGWLNDHMQLQPVVTIIERHPERGRMGVTPANFLDWSRSVTAFSAVSGSFWIEVNVNGEDGAIRLKAAKVLPGFFEVWGLSAALGRAIAPPDFEGDGRIAVVSERLWRERMLAAR